MKTLLWLDDIRNPFTADCLIQYAPQFAYGEGKVIWVKSYIEFVKWIKDNGLPYMIAFDHDLGQDIANEKINKGMNKRKSRSEKKDALSGFDCAKYLVDYCIDNEVELPQWTIQSANPVGKDNINGLLNNYRKHYNK
jgi:hypothetical protein